MQVLNWLEAHPEFTVVMLLIGTFCLATLIDAIRGNTRDRWW